ncbi:MAG: hypothetical protein JNL12_14755 [Planctomycetes bacterium]|nr:hypothetical protein [Planctomycetota bacterium]
MNHEHPPTDRSDDGGPRSDWDDRLIDAALQELHGQKPPDLSARVLLALQEAAPTASLPHVRKVPANGPARLLPWFALLAALLAVAVVTWFFTGREPRSGGGPAGRGAAPFVAFQIELLRGELVCRDGRSDEGSFVRFVARNEPLHLDLRAGANFVCAPASAFRLDRFGVLATTENTTLEIVDMAIDRTQGIVMASSLTLAVVAGTVTWHMLTRTDTAVAGETIKLEATQDGGPVASARERRLEEENKALRDELAALKDGAGRRPVEPLALSSGAEEVVEPPPPPPPMGPVFDDAQFAAALAKIDWTTMGEVSKEMAPLIAQLMEAMGKDGAKLPMDLVAKIQQLNGKLVAQVPAMLEAKLPGYGANGVYTHPLVAANTMASTLAAAGAGLTQAQQQSMSGLVRAFAAESQQIDGATREFEVEQLLEEVEMKDRFWKEVGGLLTPEQAAVLQPAGAGTHDGSSLFSSGLITQSTGVPIPAKDAGEFARNASVHLADQLGLDEAATAQVREVLAQTAAAPELWRDRGDTREQKLHMLRSGRTVQALRNQLQWMRQIQQKVNLTPEQRQKLAGLSHVLVPLPR